MAILRSHRPVRVNHWTTVTAERSYRDGSLTVDGGVAVKGLFVCCCGNAYQ
jgi:hypothetical protein